jgi:hypothetical protein
MALEVWDPKNYRKFFQDVEPFLISGIGGWPPIYTYIIPPLLGSNGSHCVKFFYHMGKLLLNLTPSEPLALVKKLPRFDDPIELDVMLEGAIHLGFHDPIKYHMFNAIRIEFCRGQVLGHVRSVQER